MPDPVTQKLFRLVHLLTEQTKSDTISWEKRATYDDDAEHYDYSTSSATVQIYTDGNRAHYPAFSVKNSDGVLIGTLQVDDRSTSEHDSPIYTLLSTVRSKALRIDETLDDLISDLESRPPF